MTGRWARAGAHMAASSLLTVAQLRTVIRQLGEWVHSVYACDVDWSKLPRLAFWGLLLAAISVTTVLVFID